MVEQKKSNKYKTCICTIVKNENLYINEWINFHLNLGIDKIYIYDNNTDEKVSDVVNNKNVVIIEDYRGIKRNFLQLKIYTDFYNTHRNEFDWIFFIDIDEFIVLNKDLTISQFLERPCFDNVDIIRLNWKHFTDNDQLDIINNDYRVFERFKTFADCEENCNGKSIIRTTVNIKNNKIQPHGYHNDQSLIVVDAEGEKCKNINWFVSNPPDYKTAWINHYRTKTIGEYIRQKFFRGDINGYDSRYGLDLFWKTNRFTKEKEDYALKLINNTINAYSNN